MAANAIRPRSDTPIVVFVGRLTFQKGVDRLIQAVASIDGDYLLQIIGEGPERGDLVEMVNSRSLTDRVKFLGFKDNPWETVAGADALVLPSRWEGFPNIALEALACGTPVIALAESGGLPEIAHAVMPGGLTICRSEEELATAISEVVAEQGIRQRQSILPKPFVLDEALKVLEDLL